MEGYIINEGQAKAIEKTQREENLFFHPVKDINGKLFIFEGEMKALIINGAFRETMKSEYVPPTPPQID